MKDLLLLVVDVQNAMFIEPPYNHEALIANIQGLITHCRNNGIEVAYVRHDDGNGTEFEYGTDLWQIYDAVAPADGEIIFDKKYNSAFVKTELKEYLNQKGINHLIIVGLQTEFCIDATVKSAFEHGFEVIIPEETNSTFDNEYMCAEETVRYFNYKIWNNRYAKLMSMEEIKNNLIQ